MMKLFSATQLLSSFLTCPIAMSASIPAQDAALAALPLEARAASPYLVAAFETRKPSSTVASFINYYDNTHVPIIKEAMGASFSLTHARYYVKRQPVSNTPVIFGGTEADFHYDVITIMKLFERGPLERY
ncbi:hypothetical protein K458DRAFT_183315 [Lentithecium fluviatile CBS 122367]|uniref:EthD domain-containing protein n=1 Tax=Lentithecium fluviatile CBS 122367 TaxID=1168545 RepID=A0A6G1IE72_9PLEO|nr:hypothetical protein K458DRAFT_183315 [Lentithecium fluviatile CBS 122367]